MKVLIIDDEQKARDVLQLLIAQLCKSIKEVITADCLADGVDLIKQHKPQIVFLDIEMPVHSGLEIVDFFKGEKMDFHIIFTTAYNKYAIDAFKISAIDYLLKPIADNELIAAVNKAESLIKQDNYSAKLEQLKKAFNQLALNKIALEVPKGISFVSVDDIIFFEADGAYTKVYLKKGKQELITKNLKHFTEQLKDNNLFYKPHRSYFINLKFMDRFVKEDGHYIILSNGFSVPIARDKREAFQKLVEMIF